MLNLVLGLAAVILGGIIIIAVLQLGALAYMWFNRKKLAKKGLDTADSLFDAMDEFLEGRKEDK